MRKTFLRAVPFLMFALLVPIDANSQDIDKPTYQIGNGEKPTGKRLRSGVRLIRLEYAGGNWDQNFGLGGDQNMLSEYGKRTATAVAEQTESRPINDLKRFPKDRAPPLVFMTGKKNISLTKEEVTTVQEYLTDKHGMLFASNGGSALWRGDFLAMMKQVLPDVRPEIVPLDDPIFTLPYQLTFVPNVAPYGGPEALGWRKDNRWICFYHPGDISGAWSTGHEGVKKEVWEACYELGTNVIFYAHMQHAKWLSSKLPSSTK